MKIKVINVQKKCGIAESLEYTPMQPNETYTIQYYTWTYLFLYILYTVIVIYILHIRYK